MSVGIPPANKPPSWGAAGAEGAEGTAGAFPIPLDGGAREPEGEASIVRPALAGPDLSTVVTDFNCFDFFAWIAARSEASIAA